MKGNCLNWSRTIYNGVEERGRAGAEDQELLNLSICSPPAKEACAIPGGAGDPGFTASWGVGCEGMGQAGHFHRIPDWFGLEGP